MRLNPPEGSSQRSVSALSEGEVVALLREHLPQQAKHVLEGIGDDAAVLAPSARASVATVDALVEEQDFLAVWPCGYRTTGWDVGFKSAAQNLSDINAMGAVATSALLVLALPANTPAHWVSEYARGFGDACAELGASHLAIVGGDLSRASVLMASVSVSGELQAQPLLRSGASAGDALVLVGETLGRADVALGLLASPAPVDAEPAWGKLERSVAAALFRPRPPLAAGPLLAEFATAAMDISDGLVRDADRLAAASRVRIDLDSRALVREFESLTSWGGRHAKRGLDHVLYGGEDHQLLATVPAARLAEVDSTQLASLRVIGSIEEGTGVFLDGEELDPAKGFDHFA